MYARDLFNEAVNEASSCVSRVEPEQLGNATPCDEWDLRALLKHMIYELAWMPDLLAGKTVAEVGNKYEGDLSGKDAAGAWHRTLELAQVAVGKADMDAIVHLSYADVTAEHYIREVGGDTLIHGWDVGQAINCSVIFDRQLAEALFGFVGPRGEEFRASGLFGEQVPVQESDSLQTKLLAFFGRKEGWQTEAA